MNNKKQANYLWILVLVAICFIGYKFGGYYLWKSRHKFVEDFLICANNCKTIGVAIELYKKDNDGLFPDDLSKLTPDYLKEIPTCPAAGYDTYSPGYWTIDNNRFYYFYCKGNYHKEVDVPGNYPQYNAEKGLIMRPGSY